MNINKATVSLAAVAVLSFFLKLQIERPTNYDANDNQILDHVADEFRARHFAILASPDVKVIGGNRDDCSFWLATARPEGGQDYYFESRYGRGLTLRFVFRGAAYAERPLLKPLLDRLLQKLSQLKGGQTALIPLFQIAYSDGCNLSELTGALDR